jgi:hypothetical protein
MINPTYLAQRTRSCMHIHHDWREESANTSQRSIGTMRNGGLSTHTGTGSELYVFYPYFYANVEIRDLDSKGNWVALNM